jgi:3-hydroxyisobutyrate dehydrogenase-like beta-hydroxyacid dehydrogenase
MTEKIAVIGMGQMGSAMAGRLRNRISMWSASTSAPINGRVS